jgi:GntR family transcriptional regulator/MocR family aminotransferase
MPSTWATSGIDLHLDLAGSRVRAGLERALRDAVQTGLLQPGTRLPSSRTLALDLGIARNTVATAYGQLVAEGWLSGRPGSGTHVAERITPGAAVAPMRDEKTVGTRYSLGAGTPDLAAFPRSRWLAAARRALNTAPNDAFGYPDPRGRPELRLALTAYLARARGVRVSPDRLVIVGGFSQGLGILAQALQSRGAQTIAMEAYGPPGQHELANAYGLRVRTIAVDDQGAVISQLGEADAVVLTPAHQFPLGMPLAAKRRGQAVQWALDSGGMIIEDDYDGEFRYDRQPVGAMQALAPEQIVYAGTTSKSLVPGLRLGWLVLPADLVDDVLEAKTRSDRRLGVIDQLTLAEFMTAGDYDRHLRRSRLVYRRRRDRLLVALRRSVPDVVITGIAAGLHALVELPDNQPEDDVIARAAELGLALEGLDSYAAFPGQRGPALVVGYGSPPEHAYTAAIARLCAALRTDGAH